MGRINRALAAAAQSGLIELWHACLGPLLSYLMMMMILMAIILTMMTPMMMYSLDLLNCGTLIFAHYYHHHYYILSIFHSYELSFFVTRNATIQIAVPIDIVYIRGG